MEKVNETIWDRIENFPGNWNLRSLSIELGMNQGYLGNYKAKGLEPKKILPRLAKILGTTPAYLMYGEGEACTPTINYDGQGLPFYDMDIFAHIAGEVVGIEPNPEYYINFPPLNSRGDLYASVRGDSMAPTFASGDIIAVKKMVTLEIIVWGEPHVVITSEEANSLRVLKLVHQHEDPKKIILRSINPEYAGDMVIDKKHIFSMFRVVGKLSILE